MPNTKLLRSIMVANGVTQRELANAVGISENTMSAKITGKRPFNTDEAIKICGLLNIEDTTIMKDIFLASPSQNRDRLKV